MTDRALQNATFASPPTEPIWNVVLFWGRREEFTSSLALEMHASPKAPSAELQPKSAVSTILLFHDARTVFTDGAGGVGHDDDHDATCQRIDHSFLRKGVSSYPNL